MITKNPRVHFKLTDEELSGIERLRKAVAAQRAVERQIPLPSRARNDPPPAGRMPFMSDSTLAHACLLHEMERRENANGQKFGQVRVPSRRLNFLQDLPELQDQLI
jgi:hypothetical protein